MACCGKGKKDSKDIIIKKTCPKCGWPTTSVNTLQKKTIGSKHVVYYRCTSRRCRWKSQDK